MKKLMVAVVVTLMAAPMVQATNYTYTGGGTVVLNGSDYETQFNDTANWDGSLTLPTTTTDDFYISSYGPGPTFMNLDNEVYLPNPGAGNTLYFGSITVDNGKIYVPSGARGTYKLSGSFVKNDVSGGADARFEVSGSNIDVTFDVGGDFLIDSHVNTGRCSTGVKYMTILMRGGSVATAAKYTMYQYSESAHQTKQVIVDNGAYVNFAGTNVYHNHVKKLDVWGTATGRVQHALVHSSTEWAPDLGGDTTELDLKLKPDGGGTRTRILAQGHFQDVSFGASGWFTSDGQTSAKLPGALRVRNLDVGTTSYGGGGDYAFIVDTDNDFVGSSNLTVDGDLKLGYSSSGKGWIGVLKANSSTIDVAGDVLVQYGVLGGVGSHILGGEAQFFVGGDWKVSDPTKSSPSWDMGTSTVTFDGSGTQIVDAGNGVPFHHVVVDQTGSTLQLDDNLVLKGNLTFDSTSTVVISNPTDAFIFKGGIDNDTGQRIDAPGVDLISVSIIAGSNSYVYLDSDLKISDNLNIEEGCKLFLNGHSLDLTGSDAAAYLHPEGPVFSGEGTWTVEEGGQIIGSEIPEPGTMLLLGTGILGVVGLIRRRRMR